MRQAIKPGLRPHCYIVYGTHDNPNRYFAGVQGDKSKQGELFGLKNIFTLDESGTATKHTVRLIRLS